MVVAYSQVLRPQLSDDRHGPPPLAIVDHLVGRLRQAQNREITTPLLDIVDRLHAELRANLPPSEDCRSNRGLTALSGRGPCGATLPV